jgi:hypothetical protein
MKHALHFGEKNHSASLGLFWPRSNIFAAASPLLAKIYAPFQNSPQRLWRLQRCPSCQEQFPIQDWLTISKPSSACEQEANWISAFVVRMPEPTMAIRALLKASHTTIYQLTTPVFSEEYNSSLIVHDAMNSSDQPSKSEAWHFSLRPFKTSAKARMVKFTIIHSPYTHNFAGGLLFKSYKN